MELMIVVTIIGVLAAIAIPVYLNYLSRAKVTEASDLIGPVKTAIADRFVQTGVLPDDNAAAHLPPPADLHGRYIQSIEVSAGGVARMTFGDSALAGKTVTWIPAVNGQQLDWTCITTLPAESTPKDCL